MNLLHAAMCVIEGVPSIAGRPPMHPSSTSAVMKVGSSRPNADELTQMDSVDLEGLDDLDGLGDFGSDIANFDNLLPGAGSLFPRNTVSHCRKEGNREKVDMYLYPMIVSLVVLEYELHRSCVVLVKYCEFWMFRYHLPYLVLTVRPIWIFTTFNDQPMPILTSMDSLLTWKRSDKVLLSFSSFFFKFFFFFFQCVS